MSFLYALGTLAVIGGSIWIYQRVFATRVRPLPPTNSARKPFVWEPPKIDCSRAALLGDMESTRARPIEKLPISVDLPRLARKTIIYTGDELVFNGPDPNNDHLGGTEVESRTKLIELVWKHLAKLLNEERDCYETLSAEIQGGDTSACLALFMREHYTDDSRVIRVLKVCNQSLLAPTVVRMKEIIGTKYSYKDQRGKWIIVIRRLPQSVVVTHTKMEMSWESQDKFDEQHFEFTWSLKIELDPTGEKLLDVGVTIDNLEFVETVPLATRNKIIDTFNSAEFLEPIPHAGEE